MHAEERQQTIMHWVRERGRVDVAEFAAQFEIAAETVRRDLTVLEQRGVIRRVHGGAIPVENADSLLAPRDPVDQDTVMAAEKERIAKAALAEVPEEGAILLDAGSTVARLARALPADRELTIVTHSVSMALSLSSRTNITLMLLGGRIRGRSMAVVDSWALQALRDTYVDVAFLATGGVSVERGLTTPDAAEAMVKRAAIASARRTVLLADHTKVGKDHLARFGDLADIDTFITDTGIDPQRTREIAATGSRVVTA